MNEFVKALNLIEEQHERDNEQYLRDFFNGKPAKLPAFTISYGDLTVSFPTELADIDEGFIHCLQTMRDCSENIE